MDNPADALAPEPEGVLPDIDLVAKTYKIMLYEALYDPEAFGRRLNRALGDDPELTPEEARELWDDCWPFVD